MFAELFSASTEPTERSPLRLFCSEPPLITFDRKIEQEEEKIRKEIKVLISEPLTIGCYQLRSWRWSSPINKSRIQHCMIINLQKKGLQMLWIGCHEFHANYICLRIINRSEMVVINRLSDFVNGGPRSCRIACGWFGTNGHKLYPIDNQLNWDIWMVHGLHNQLVLTYYVLNG